jgi:hypothetical protein
MTIIIDKNMSKKEFKNLLNRPKSKTKGVSIKALAGKLKWKGDALKVQRSLRSEQ